MSADEKENRKILICTVKSKAIMLEINATVKKENLSFADCVLETLPDNGCLTIHNGILVFPL